MASITLKGNPLHTSGNLPSVGSKAPAFELVRQDLSTATLDTFKGYKVLNIFPSVDTAVCATSVRKFNEKASNRNATVLNISGDLPFAFKRFCGAEGLEGVETLSCYRSDFAKAYGVAMTDGPMMSLCARAVVVVDGDNKVVHAELVPEIVQEPNYDAALTALG